MNREQIKDGLREKGTEFCAFSKYDGLEMEVITLEDAADICEQLQVEIAALKKQIKEQKIDMEGLQMTIDDLQADI